ncbi:hypothetical protein ACVPOS_13720 [Staphylococcus aureus]
MTHDEEEAAFLAEQVEHFNRERKDIVATISRRSNGYGRNESLKREIYFYF